MRKGKAEGPKEKSILVVLEYLRLLEGMKLKEEEWERIKLKMRTAGIPASQEYYDVSFAEALNLSSEEELKLRFYPREGFEVADLKLSEEDKKKLLELTEKVLRAVGLEGKVVIVPLKGVPYEWT